MNPPNPLPQAWCAPLRSTGCDVHQFSAACHSFSVRINLYCFANSRRVIAGCTAVVALAVGTSLYVANAGDSRGVLCRGGEAYALSEDHKPQQVSIVVMPFCAPSNLLCSVHPRKRSCRGSPRLVGMSTSSAELMGTLTYPG